MRAVVIRAPGSMRVESVPDPTPPPGEVLVRVGVGVGACGICGTDLHIIDGDSPLARYPIMPGQEFAGEAVVLGGEIAQESGNEDTKGYSSCSADFFVMRLDRQAVSSSKRIHIPCCL